MSKTKHLFIINPAAGKTNAADTLTREIEKAFSLLNHEENEYEIALTEKKGDATEITRRASESGEPVRVYACGGDGTLNEVINGAVLCPTVSVCPVPVGSGNDFVRSFDAIPKEKFLDIAACMNGSVIPCDAMRMGDKYSVNVISAGMDAVTGRRQGTVKKIPFVSGGFAYKLALVSAFITSMKTKIRFELDDEAFDPGDEYITIAVLGNGCWYGGGFKAAPYAEIGDGLMDFVTVKKISRIEFLRYVGIYKRGEHIEKMPYVKFKKCRKLAMYSDKPITVQLDGEAFDVMNPVFELVPAALNLILPE